MNGQSTGMQMCSIPGAYGQSMQIPCHYCFTFHSSTNGYSSGNPGQAGYGYSSGNNGSDGYGGPAGYGYSLGNLGQAEYSSGNTGQAGYTSGNTGTAGYSSGNPGPAGYTSTSPGPPGYGYSLTNPGATGYDYSSVNPGPASYESSSAKSGPAGDRPSSAKSELGGNPASSAKSGFSLGNPKQTGLTLKYSSSAQPELVEYSSGNPVPSRPGSFPVNPEPVQIASSGNPQPSQLGHLTMNPHPPQLGPASMNPQPSELGYSSMNPQPSELGYPSQPQPSQLGYPSQPQPSQLGYPSQPQPSQLGYPSMNPQPSRLGYPSMKTRTSQLGYSSINPELTGLNNQNPNQFGQQPLSQNYSAAACGDNQGRFSDQRRKKQNNRIAAPTQKPRCIEQDLISGRPDTKLYLCRNANPEPSNIMSRPKVTEKQNLNNESQPKCRPNSAPACLYAPLPINLCQRPVTICPAYFQPCYGFGDPCQLKKLFESPNQSDKSKRTSKPLPGRKFNKNRGRGRGGRESNASDFVLDEQNWVKICTYPPATPTDSMKKGKVGKGKVGKGKLGKGNKEEPEVPLKPKWVK